MARDAPRHFPKGGFLPTAKGGLMGESEERGGFKGSKGGLMAESEGEERGGFRSVLWGGYRECSRALLLCVNSHLAYRV